MVCRYHHTLVVGVLVVPVPGTALIPTAGDTQRAVESWLSHSLDVRSLHRKVKSNHV
jgi:hypothetical protein